MADPADRERPRRLAHQGELVSAVSAVFLLAVMFLIEWYGVAGVPDPSAARPAVSSDENAWGGLPVVRWVMLLTIAVALGSVIIHVSQRSHGAKTDTSRIVTLLGAVTAALLVYRVLIDLPGSGKVIDQKLGAFLGLLGALGIACGGYDSMREERTEAGSVVQRSRRSSRLASGRRAR